MVKRYYIKDYSDNFRGNTETRTVASDFIRPSIESSLTSTAFTTVDRRNVLWGNGVFDGNLSWRRLVSFAKEPRDLQIKWLSC